MLRILSISSVKFERFGVGMSCPQASLRCVQTAAATESQPVEMRIKKFNVYRWVSGGDSGCCVLSNIVCGGIDTLVSIVGGGGGGGGGGGKSWLVSS